MYTLDKLLKIAKKFTVSQRKRIENEPMPIMRFAYIDEEYIWATNGDALIRIEHGTTIPTPYLHPYSKTDAAADINLHALPYYHAIPDFHLFEKMKITDINRWKRSHEMAKSIKADKFKATLDTQHRTLSASLFKKEVYGGRLSFSDKNLPIELNGPGVRVSYNAQNMIKSMQAMKQLKNKEAYLYIDGRQKPFVMKSDRILIVMKPLFDTLPQYTKAQQEKRVLQTV